MNFSKLWEYLTKWFRLIEIKDKNNKSRNKDTKKWEYIKKSFGINKDDKLKRAYPEVNGKNLDDKFKKLLMKTAVYHYEKPMETIMRIIKEVNEIQYIKYNEIYENFINKRDMERFNDNKYHVPF